MKTRNDQDIQALKSSLCYGQLQVSPPRETKSNTSGEVANLNGLALLLHQNRIQLRPNGYRIDLQVVLTAEVVCKGSRDLSLANFIRQLIRFANVSSP